MVAFDSQQVEDQIVDLKCRTLNDFSPTKKYDTLTFLNCLTEVLKNSSDTDTMTEEIEKTRELWIDTFDSDEDGLEPRDGLEPQLLHEDHRPEDEAAVPGKTQTVVKLSPQPQSDDDEGKSQEGDPQEPKENKAEPYPGENGTRSSSPAEQEKTTEPVSPKPLKIKRRGRRTAAQMLVAETQTFLGSQPMLVKEDGPTFRSPSRAPPVRSIHEKVTKVKTQGIIKRSPGRPRKYPLKTENATSGSSVKKAMLEELMVPEQEGKKKGKDVYDVPNTPVKPAPRRPLARSMSPSPAEAPPVKRGRGRPRKHPVPRHSIA